jgi:hypothetical protein
MSDQQYQFRVWRCLGRALVVLGRNFVPFYALALLITVFPVLYDLAVDAESFDPTRIAFRFTGNWVLDMVGWFAGFVLLNLLSAAIIFGTTQELRGQRAGIGQCIGRGLSLIVPTILAAFIVAIATGLGLIFLVVPGLVIFIVYWFVIPVVVMERPGVLASLARSADLTKGVRWRLFGMILISLSVGLFIQGMVILVTVPVYFVQGNQVGPIIGGVLYFLINALASAYYAVVNAVAYYDIRHSKEAIEVEQIAAVFD